MLPCVQPLPQVHGCVVLPLDPKPSEVHEKPLVTLDGQDEVLGVLCKSPILQVVTQKTRGLQMFIGTYSWSNLSSAVAYL